MKEIISTKRFLAFLLCVAMLVMYMPSPGVAFADETTGDEAAVAVEEPAPAPEPEPEPEPTPAPAPAPAVEPAPEPAPAPAEAEPSGGSDGSEEFDAEIPSEGEEVPSGEVSVDADAEDQDDAIEGEVTNEEVVAEEEEEDAEEEEKYPAVTLSETVNGVTVTLSAPEGGLPEGAKLSVKSVTRQDVFDAVEERIAAEGKEMTDAIAFDVTPLDKDGNEIQPRKSVTVTFSGTGLETGDGGVDVFRVSDNAASVTEMSTTVATGIKQQFTTDHFTIYVSTSTGGGDPAYPNGGDDTEPNATSHRLVLEYGEVAYLESTEHDKKYNVDNFSLSYSSGDGISVVNTEINKEPAAKVTNNNNSISDIEATVVHTYGKKKDPQTEEYYILAKTKIVPVTFNIMQPGDSTYTLVSTQEVYMGKKATVPDHQETIKEGGKTYKFYGWYSDEACTVTADPDDVITSSNGVNFYARYAQKATLTYNRNTNDAVTMPDPSSVTTGVGMNVTIGSASRSEYGFLGWAESPTATEADPKYDPGKVIAMPEEGLTLYAVWTESTETIYIYYDCSPSSTTIPRTEASARSQANLSDTIPERNQEQVFVGWSETKHAASPTYYPGQTVETEDENIYLYAVWGHLSDWERTVSVNGRKETYDGNTYEITIVGEEEPNADGYIDLGVYHNKRYYIKASDIYASGTNVGTYSTPIMAQLYDYKHDNYRPVNFYIEVNNTKLIILPAEVKIETDSASKPYDGTALTAGGKVTFPAEGGTEYAFPHEGGTATLAAGETISIKTTASQTDIGSTENTYEVDWGNSTAKKHNYSFEEILGTLEVTSAETYTVTWLNEDGTELEKDENVAKGATPSYDGETPTKKADAQYTYTFDKWSPELAEVTEDVTYTATYTPTVNKYTVKFVDEDGTVLSEGEYDYGTSAEDIQPETNPTMSEDAQYTYTFDRWDPELAEVTGDATYTATYTATAKPSPAPTPTPAGTTDDDDDDNAGNAGGGRAATTVAAAAAPAAPAAPATPADDIADEPTPTTEPPATTIDDEPTPTTLTWAVANLVMAIMTALGAVIALFRKKEDEDDEDESADKKMLAAKIAGALAGVAAPITFFLTENMADVAVAFDKWTPLMAGILAVQVVSAVLNKAASKAADAAEEAAE